MSGVCLYTGLINIILYSIDNFLTHVFLLLVHAFKAVWAGKITIDGRNYRYCFIQGLGPGP